MFDLLFVLVVGLSTAFAALRGGLRELSTLLSLALAGGVTLLLAEPVLAATGQQGSFFGTVIIAAGLVAILFVLAHIAFHIGLKRVPLEGRAALADRIGGGAFGLVRGLILVGLGYLGYSYYLDEARQPDEVKNALTRPIAAGVAGVFESFTPEDAYIENEFKIDNQTGDATAEGYDAADRSGLSEIVTTVTTTDPELEAILAEDQPEPQEVELSEDDPMAEILRRSDEEDE